MDNSAPINEAFFKIDLSHNLCGKDYIHVWNVDLSKNVIGDALEELGFITKSVSSTDFLADKLSSIRNQVKYDTMWRTPTLEELKEGDIVQIQTSYGWSEGKWPEVLNHDTHVNLFGGDTIESKFKYASLRIANK